MYFCDSNGSTMKRLSLLSRGKCEVGQSPSGQFPVTLEPHDLHTPVGGLPYTGVRAFGDSSIYMPPPGVHQHTLPRLKREANLPKTYLTKKGALFLYSEDFARFHREIVPPEVEDNFRNRQMNISTADLTLAISRYEQSQNKYNRFLRDRGDVKPGHSARRHLVAWHLAHPGLGALGSRFTKHDRRSRRTRGARTSLNVVPMPYNLPKSLDQIRKGLRSREGSPERDAHHHVQWATHSMWSPGIHPIKSKLRMPPIQHIRTAQPVLKAPALKQWTRPPSPRPAAPEVDTLSSLSSEARFTRTHLPSIYKNPSQLHKVKDSVNGVNGTDATNVVRKKVRIQLDPVIFPTTDSPELERIY